MSALALDRPAGDLDSPAATSEAGDLRQADYFLRLLAQTRHLLDHRIQQYRRAITACEANGDLEGAASLRRMAHREKQDRETLDQLIENLHRRFPRRRARLAVR